LVVRTCGIGFVLSRYLHHAVHHFQNPSTARERDRAFRVVERDRLPGAGLEDDFFPLTILEPQGVSAGRLPRRGIRLTVTTISARDVLNLLRQAHRALRRNTRRSKYSKD